MYVPIIRAKQFDLDALTELPTALIESELVVPVIVPVVKIKPRRFKLLADSNYRFILVLNPVVGEFKSKIPHPDIVDKLVNDVYAGYKNCILGFVIHSGTTLREVKKFIEEFPEHQHAFIHEFSFSDPAALKALIATDKKREFNIYFEGHSSSEYNSIFHSLRTSDIIIADGFTKQINNASYPPEDFFSDLHKTYNERGYDGFGDYTIMGKKFDTSGGPAHAVAIHFTFVNSTDDIWVKHYVSDDTTNPTNPGGKFLQALTKLKVFLRASPQYATVGANEYRAMVNYPGLGIVKKHSMKHHIELMYEKV